MKKIFSSKKAQITIFIIIGIILLFSSALIFYIKNKVTGSNPDPIIIQQQLPEDLEGIKKYVDQCIYSTGKQAVTILGSQGGYIYPKEYGIIGDVNNPTEGTGIHPFKNIQNYIIPYWYYLESPNTCNGDCVFAQKKPADISVLEDQISRYIVENLEYCISDFEIYKNMGYTIKLNGPITVKTTIARNDVVLDVNWPMRAGQENQKDLKQFLVKLPVNLRSIYNFADKIMFFEQNQSMVARYTLNIIMSYAADKIPSSGKLSYIEIFQAGTAYKWSFVKTRNDVTDYISQYTRAIKVKNTLNYDPYSLFDENPVVQSAKFKMVIDNNSTEQYPYEVDFRYSKTWPLYFDITPRDGDVVKGSSTDFGVLMLLGMAIRRYDFKYDISYPVVATISDPQAFYGEGYDFSIAFESNIRNNKVLKSDFYALSVDGGKTGFECDEEQKKTKNITVNIIDGRTGGPLKDAMVSVYFGKSGCTVGETNAKGVSVERYPKGIGEIMASKKPDYLSIKTLFAAKENTTDNYNFTLYPFEEKDVVIKRIVVSKNYTINNGECYGYWTIANTTPVKLVKNETISAYFKRIQTPDSPDMSTTAVDYTYETQNITQTVKLAPGKYELRVMAVLYKNLTIPSQTKTIETDDQEFTLIFNQTSSYPYNEGVLEFIGADNTIKSTMAQITAEDLAKANAEITKETGRTFTVTADQLQNTNLVPPSTFYFEVKAEDLYKDNNYLEIYALVYDLESVPLNCRKQDPNDMMPTPDARTLLNQNKILLTPTFKINKG